MIWRKHPILEPPTDEEIVEFDEETLVSIHAIYHEAIENAERDPYRFGFRLPHWAKAEEQLHEVSEIVALGGNRSGKKQEATTKLSYCATHRPSTPGPFVDQV
jgi:hypothetical protein